MHKYWSHQLWAWTVSASAGNAWLNWLSINACVEDYPLTRRIFTRMLSWRQKESSLLLLQKSSSLHLGRRLLVSVKDAFPSTWGLTQDTTDSRSSARSFGSPGHRQPFCALPHLTWQEATLSLLVFPASYVLHQMHFSTKHWLAGVIILICLFWNNFEAVYNKSISKETQNY